MDKQQQYQQQQQIKVRTGQAPRTCGWCRHYRYVRPGKVAKAYLLGVCARGRGAAEYVSHRDKCGGYQYGGKRVVDVTQTADCIVVLMDTYSGLEVRVPLMAGETVMGIWEYVRDYFYTGSTGAYSETCSETWDVASKHITTRTERIGK